MAGPGICTEAPRPEKSIHSRDTATTVCEPRVVIAHLPRNCKPARTSRPCRGLASAIGLLERHPRMHIARQPTSHVTGEQKVSSFSPARPVNKCMDGRSSVRRRTLRDVIAVRRSVERNSMFLIPVHWRLVASLSCPGISIHNASSYVIYVHLRRLPRACPLLLPSPQGSHYTHDSLSHRFSRFSLLRSF